MTRPGPAAMPAAAALPRVMALAVAIAIAAIFVPTAGFPAARASSTASALSWASSGSSDSIGKGVDGHFTDAAATFAAAPPTGAGAATVHIAAGTDSWEFSFLTQSGVRLQSGDYSTALGATGAVEIKGPSMAARCGAGGNFTVLEVTYDATDQVTSLAVHFDGRCYSDPDGASFAVDLRFHSSIGFALASAPDSVAFGLVPYTATATRSVALGSTGTGNLHVTSVALTGPDAAYFTISADACTGADVAPGAECVVSVSYTAAMAWRQAVLRFTTTAARSIVDVGLSGSYGPRVVVDRPTVDFGEVFVLEPTADETVTVSNQGANSVTLDPTTTYPSDPTHFVVTQDTCSGATIAAGGTCAVKVHFVTADPSNRSTTLWFGLPSAEHSFPTPTVKFSALGKFHTATFAQSGIHNAAPDGTWNAGGALARTTAGSASYLHAVSIGGKVGSAAVRDTGPYSPVFYTRSGNGGSAWTAGLRLNATTQHGVWPGMAAAGANVYASWVSVARVVSWSSTAPRAIWFRSNTNHGTGAWGAPKRLTSATGQVDYPSIAAAGTNVYIAYTDALSGALKMLVSHDSGGTWTTVTLGAAGLVGSTIGWTGQASVAASGSNVIVAWDANSGGAVRSRISTTAGATWLAPTVLTRTSTSYPSAAALGDRLGVAFISTQPKVRIWTPAGWGQGGSVSGVNHSWLEEIYGPALVLVGTSTVGVGYSGCVQACATYQANGTHLESYYSESTSNGYLWWNGYSLPVADGPVPGAEDLSVVASSPTKREFTYRAWYPATTRTRLVHRTITVTPDPVGTAAPVHALGPTSSAGPSAGASGPAIPLIVVRPRPN